MNRLTLLLIGKIIFTMLTVAMPFLFLAPDRIAEMSTASVPAPMLYRLYGVAVIALLVGYAFAVPVAQRGQIPLSALVMGVVSNGGAAFVLVTHSAQGAALLLAIVFGTIAVLLAVSIVAPTAALKSLTGSK